MKKFLFLFFFFTFIFGDTLILNYQKACSLAVENCLLKKIGEEKVKEKYFARLTSLSNFFPSLNLSFAYSHLSEVPYFVSGKPIFGKYPFPVYDIFGNLIGFTESIPVITGYQIESIPFGKKDNYLLRVGLSQPIFTFFKILRGYKIAQLNELIEKENYWLTINNLKKQVINLFYQTLLLRKQKELLLASYEQLKRHRRACSTLYRAGLLTKLELLKTALALDGLTINLTQVAQSESILLFNLRLFLGLKDKEEIVLIDPVVEKWEKEELVLKKTEENLDSLLALAKKERRELKSLVLTKEIIKNTINIQKSSFLPNIVSSYNYEYKKPSSFFDDKWKGSGTFTLAINLSLSLGGGEYTRLKSLEHQLKEIDFYYQWSKELIANEVKQLYFKYLTTFDNFDYTFKQVKVAKEALKEAEEGFRLGKVSNLEYLDTELKLREAKLANLKSLLENLITKKELEYALGKEIN